MGVRVWCFAHAGAGVSAFHLWPKLIGPGVEPDAWLLPGRDARRGEARVTDPAALLEDLAPLVESLARAQEPSLPSEPYVLYGHSLGGMVAHALTRHLHERGLPLPALLAIGAAPPPDGPAALAASADLPDTALLRLLDTFDAVPAGTEPGDVWHRMVFPVLRDDLRLAGALRTAAAGRTAAPRPLPVPILAVAGREDPLVTPEVVAGWARWTTGPFAHRTLPGGHFFVRDRALPRLIGRAARVVERLAATGPAGAVPAAAGPAGAGVRRR
ncbi:thioesterase domain-containing protein (plasmid) [Streptomyces sp. NBC_01351]|uniref:thioesterase II family protein n=1 Tax=Streptomyces sp. NBC_01351 TaxID=2903833 RepID=UPI002E318A21|nr:alpha/beta fold hydrolase [Streptomyces sp. NBC_01351]